MSAWPSTVLRTSRHTPRLDTQPRDRAVPRYPPTYVFRRANSACCCPSRPASRRTPQQELPNGNPQWGSQKSLAQTRNTGPRPLPLIQGSFGGREATVSSRAHRAKTTQKQASPDLCTLSSATKTTIPIIDEMSNRKWPYPCPSQIGALGVGAGLREEGRKCRKIG